VSVNVKEGKVGEGIRKDKFKTLTERNRKKEGKKGSSRVSGKLWRTAEKRGNCKKKEKGHPKKDNRRRKTGEKRRKKAICIPVPEKRKEERKRKKTRAELFSVILAANRGEESTGRGRDTSILSWCR